MATRPDIGLVEASPFQSILNFRDVGRSINRLQSKMQVHYTGATSR